MKPRLTDFARNVYSQAGEDGILEAIFERIGMQSRVCIEFGAWDGLHLSNTALFWHSGWRAVLIEASPDRFRSLLQNTSGYDCLCLNQMVTPEGHNALESLLNRNGVDGPADLLVIDVDGDDYQILAGLKTLRPRVVCVEFNPTIPMEMPLVGRTGDGLGCSAKALVMLAKEMGYVLVAMTAVNCVFVREEEAAVLTGFETSFEALFPAANLVCLITTYDGRYLLSREPPYGLSFPHDGRLDEGRVVRVGETWIQWLATRASVLWHRGQASLIYRASRLFPNGSSDR